MTTCLLEMIVWLLEMIACDRATHNGPAANHNGYWATPSD
jgi:hypothetical protein